MWGDNLGMSMRQYRMRGAAKLLLGLVVVIAMVMCALPQRAKAGPLSDYMEQQVLRYWFQSDLSIAARPSTLYVGLSTAVCSDSALAGEPSGGGYARVATAATSSFWLGPTGGDGTVRNAGAIVFPAPTSTWGTMVSFFVADASSAGNVLLCAPLTASRLISAGDGAPTFAASALTFRIDD